MKKVWFIRIYVLCYMQFCTGKHYSPTGRNANAGNGGQFVITAKTPIILEGSGLENSANFLNEYLQQLYGFKLPVKKKASAGPGIYLNYERMDYPYPAPTI